jgi:hypothetical protein
MSNTCSTHEEALNAYKSSGVKHEEKEPLERNYCRWKNIKIHIKERGCEDLDPNKMNEDRALRWAFQNAIMKLQFP